MAAAMTARQVEVPSSDGELILLSRDQPEAFAQLFDRYSSLAIATPFAGSAWISPRTSSARRS